MNGLKINIFVYICFISQIIIDVGLEIVLRNKKTSKT